MLTDTELIRKLDFFEPLDQRIIKQIASLCIVREFAAGEAIVRQGESGLGLYFITGGRAKVEIDKDGTKVVVAELKEGDFLGEFSIIDDKTRSASVVCLQDTRCLLLTRDSFSKLLKKHPEIASQMLRTLVSRIRNTNERVTLSPGARPPEPPPPPVAEPTPSDRQETGGLTAATSQLAAMLPKPEDMVQFYSSTKGKTQDFLNRFVSAIYAMKAMLRFSMAIVGCPVLVSAERPGEEILEASLHDVKLLLFPAASEQTIRIEAVGDGFVSATIYRPAGTERNPQVEVLRLHGPVRRRDVLRVHVPISHPIRMEPSWANPNEFAGSAETAMELPATSSSHRWLVSQARWQ
ncbi:MAG: cyclic nucleotide-binding domain-containing protein [Acidobacteria bacterium]|nr:cyclic nucleotide-binding domain-containing protein [Acidobacteriota bacterium]